MTESRPLWRFNPTTFEDEMLTMGIMDQTRLVKSSGPITRSNVEISFLIIEWLLSQSDNRIILELTSN